MYTWIQCFMLSLYSLSSSLNEWCKITVACSYLYSDAGEAKDTFDFHVLAAVVASRISYGKHAWVHVNILPSRRCLCYCGMNVKRERVSKHILCICIYICVRNALSSLWFVYMLSIASLMYCGHHDSNNTLWEHIIRIFNRNWWMLGF